MPSAAELFGGGPTAADLFGGTQRDNSTAADLFGGAPAASTRVAPQGFKPENVPTDVMGDLALRGSRFQDIPENFAKDLASQAVGISQLMGMAVKGMGRIGGALAAGARSGSSPLMAVDLGRTFSPEAWKREVLRPAGVMGQSIMEGAKEVARHPIKSAIENPFTAMTLALPMARPLMVGTAAGAEAGAMRLPIGAAQRALARTGNVARGMAATAAASGPIEAVGQAATNALRKRSGVLDEAMTAHEQGSAAGNLFQNAQKWQSTTVAKNALERNQVMAPVDKNPALQSQWWRVLTGHEPLNTSTPEPVQKGAQWWIGKNAQAQSDLINAQVLTPEQGAQRALQPLRVTRYGIQAEREATTEEIANRTADILASLPKDQMAYYTPFIREPKLSDLWRAGVSAKQPAFLKHSGGELFASNRYVKDIRVALGIHDQQFVKWQATRKLLSDLENSPTITKRLWDGNEASLGKNEVLFVPGATRAFYDMQFDFGNKVASVVGRGGDPEGALASAFEDAAKRRNFEAAAAAIKKSPVYVVNRAVMERMRQEFRPTSNAIRLFYDHPTDYWRAMVLAGRPAWIVNNTVGNVTFNGLAGVGPGHYAAALDQRYLAKTPESLNGLTFTSAEGAAARLGPAANTPVGQLYQWLEKQPVAKQLGSYVDMMNSKNQAIESYFRNANYLKQADKIARSNYVKRTGDKFLSAYKLLDEMDTLTPVQVEQAIKGVNFFLNDYGALNPTERAVIRRVVPFYNFAKFSLRLQFQLPDRYPGAALMLNQLARLGNEAAAYDSHPLPDFLRGRGIVDTGQSFDVDGKRYRAYASTSGSNPFMFNAPSGGEVSFDPSSMLQTALSSAHPWVQRLLRPDKDAFGRPYTTRGPVTRGGQAYELDPELKQALPVRQPIGDVATFGGGPQWDLLRSQVNPRARYTAGVGPVSALGEALHGQLPTAFISSPPSQTTTRTEWQALMRYFGGPSLILVDETSPTEPYQIPLKEQRAIKAKIAAQEEAAQTTRVFGFKVTPPQRQTAH